MHTSQLATEVSELRADNMRIKSEIESERTNKNHIEINLKNQIKIGANEMKDIAGQLHMKGETIESLEKDKASLLGKLDCVETSNRNG